LVTGVTAYAFLVLTARVLGTTRYAPLSVLWALVFLFGPGFFLPLEQEVGRLVAARRVHGSGGGPVVRRAAALGGALAAILLIATGAIGGVLTHSLFDGQALLLVGFALGLIGYFVSHLTRGALSGNGHFPAYSVALGADGLLRLIICVVLAVVGVKSAGPYGLVLGLTPALAAILALRGQRNLLAPGPEAPWRDVSRAVGWLLVASVSAQVLANSSVIAVKLLATPAQTSRAGRFLAGLVIARIPLFLFGAVQAALLPRLAALAGEGRDRQFTAGVIRLLGAIVLLGLLATIACVAVGPQVVRTMFGSKFQLGRADLAYLAAASAALMATLAISQALIALGHHASSVVGWLVGIVVFIAVTAIGSALLRRVEVGFMAGAFASAGVAGYALAVRLPQRRQSSVVTDSMVVHLDQLGIEP
jgi:O-antigen/teichoic acid export membrane protein